MTFFNSNSVPTSQSLLYFLVRPDLAAQYLFRNGQEEIPCWAATRAAADRGLGRVTSLGLLLVAHRCLENN